VSYSEILTLLNETHQNMEQKRTRFHDSKKAITRAETLLTEFKEEKVDYRKLDLKKAKSAFESGDYELSSTHANKASDVAENDLSELKKLKLERESLDGLIDKASKDELEIDKAAIKDLDKAIKRCDLSKAKESISLLKKNLENKLREPPAATAAIAHMQRYHRESILKTAPKEWAELEKIDKYAEVDDYCENGIWDIDGLRDDLKLMREKLGKKVKASPAPKAAAQRKVRKKAKRPAAPPDKSGGTSKMQELRELLEMKKEGLINDEEFKQLKKEILRK